jgi:hypothetical protein
VGRLGLTPALAALVAVVALCVPASAFADNAYVWSQPGDVTSATQYGVPSWSYSASTAPLSFASAFTGNGQTLAGYTDNASAPTTWIAAPTSGSPAALEMVPAAGRSVTLTWTSPFSSSATVDLSGSITEPNQASGLLSSCGTTWTLTNGATPVQSGSAKQTTLSSTPVTVAAGGTLQLTVTDASTGLISPYTTACVETDVNLTLSVASSQVTPSAVRVTAPTPNQQFTSAQPTFTGGAGDGFGYSPSVTVRVYSGSSASGTPVQTMATTESGGRWSVAPNRGLANGTYTVQAEQDDLAGDAYLSNTRTFTVNLPDNVAPTVTIDPLASSTLTTATPTFTGTAGTDTGDSEVELDIYTGTDASGIPIDRLLGPVDGSGHWSISVSPALVNGQYTAVARQLGPPPSSLLGSSDPVPFTISAAGPPPPPLTTLTLTHPQAGAIVSQSAKLVFSGAASTASGDSSTIVVTLYRGGAANGKPVGTVHASASNGTWRATWPRKLALGLYTARATQANGQGGTDVSQAVTFLVVPHPGASVLADLSRSRLLSIPITCQITTGDCAGTVLATTVKSYQPVAGGPIGRLRLLFSYVAIPAGHTMIVRGHVSRAVQRALRHKKRRSIKVRVTTSLDETGIGVVKTTSTLALRLH